MKTNSKYTADQLRLAADLLETEHPWEYKTAHPFSGWKIRYPTDCPLTAIVHNRKIRPILATPPDNRPLHNPDNLRAEQVEVGYRLTLPSETSHKDAEVWNKETRSWSNRGIFEMEPYDVNITYRLPLSVPWPDASETKDPYAELKAAHATGKVIQYRSLDCPEWRDQCGVSWNPPDAPYKPEYRIKPEAPAFQLPPPPPGMRWHREDGWKEGDLPSGYRPLVLEEREADGDEDWNYRLERWKKCYKPFIPLLSHHSPTRTRRPLTFEHAGKTWTWHRPGDPMPCDGERTVEVLFTDRVSNVQPASYFFWDESVIIIGWRYADEKKTVPLGPEDMKPFTIIRRKGEAQTWHWRTVSYVDAVKVTCGNRGYGWDELVSDYERNESLPITGKWNPDAWEPCHKIIPQNP